MTTRAITIIGFALVIGAMITLESRRAAM